MRAAFSRRLRGALAALLVLTSVGAASAMTILPLDLPELTNGAGRIFVGRVERIDTGLDTNGLAATWTTFVVDHALKGDALGPITLKQLGTSFGGDATRVVPHAGLPRYRPGESVLLFVHPESALGFTSPVGLGQGCFRILDRDGQRLVENDVGNRNLAADANAANAARSATNTAAAPAPNLLPLATLVGRVRALVDPAP